MNQINRIINAGKKLFLILLLCQLTAPVVGGEQKKSTKTLAPGYRDLGFSVPIPGTYQLPLLGNAGDGEVLTAQGKPTTLHSLMANDKTSAKVVVLSFIYSTCSDVNGCPLAMAVFHKLENKLAKEPEVAAKLRLLTLSFNPEYDTPQRMQEYGAGFQGKNLDWQFLTTRSEQQLQPILKSYQQNVVKVFDDKGKFTNTFNHSLRVYLIDQNKQIRNIYNTDLLHPDTLISDIKTLLQANAKLPVSAPKSVDSAGLFSAGDNKQNYLDKGYQTQSLALAHRQGRSADLLKTISKPILGLPAVPIPGDNLISLAKINLGKKLFYDRRLSLNKTFSCAMCHVPEQGFTSNEMATAVGVEGRTVRRNSPTLYNVAYMQTLFHDGRETSLENQVWGPLLARNEMANPSIGYVIDTIKQSADYNGLFEKAFSKPVNIETIGMAIASYERTLNSANSPFDRWYFGKNKQALNAKAQRGFALFIGKAGCSQCHTISEKHALFTDNKLHNTGLGFESAMNKPALTQRVQVAPGVFTTIANEVVNSVSETKANDLGRYEVTQKPEDRWQYKTPSLRNVDLTAPYMHNGSLVTLRNVVEFYNQGGIANENLDNLIKPLHLSETEIDELTEFLKNLTGSNVDELVSDAFAAPVGNSK